MELTNSTRSLDKATHVRLDVTVNPNSSGRALHKSSFLRSLALQDGEVDKAYDMAAARTKRLADSQVESRSTDKGDVQKLTMDDMGPVLRKFEGKKTSLELPSPAILADVPTRLLLDFGKRVIRLRQAELDEAKNQPQAARSAIPSAGLEQRYNAVHTALATNAVFESNLAAFSVGMLNLERLEMTPAGIERGELIATIPLAPGEKTNVVQQEWSTVSSEFTSIVTDSLEEYSETGVAESSELAQATNSQNTHANQFNVTASASGGCGFVTGSVSTSFGMQDQDSVSASDSRKHAESMTKKASSRVKKDKQITISTNSASGSSSATTRTLENTSTTEPMRVDYFSMMRKWHVALYRYGLRLTFDLTVPEPGASFRQIYSDLEQLETNLRDKFVFDLDIGDISPDDYTTTAAKYGVKAPMGPPAALIKDYSGSIPNLKEDNDSKWVQNELVINLEPGYQVKHITLDLLLSNWNPEPSDDTPPRRVFSIVGCRVDTTIYGMGKDRQSFDLEDFLRNREGTIKIVYFAQYYGNGMYSFHVEQEPSNTAMMTWRTNLLNSLYDAALTEFTAKQTLQQARLQKLQDQLANVDTLTLRREENDEIMKSVLRWLLGPEFQFVPQEVQDAFNRSNSNNEHGIHWTDNEPVSKADWSTMARYGKEITFLNEAIEWENVVYFLYSYFWDDPRSWKFIRNLQHNDATRQAFLRSGSARVVLTIRSGYERAFAWYADRGTLEGIPKESMNPYMRIAEQIEKYDQTNYPGIPPANPVGTANIGGQHAGTVGIVAVSPGEEVEIRVTDATGFLVDNIVVIDTAQSGLRERQKIVKVIKERRHAIVVEKLENRHGWNEETPEYPIYQAGEKGLLIAEWYEYTPSHGTMISINSTLDEMS